MWCRKQRLIATDRPNQAQLQHKPFMNTLQVTPALLWKRNLSGQLQISLFIMSLHSGSLDLKCRFCLLYCCCLCKSYFPSTCRYCRCFLQRSLDEIPVMAQFQFRLHRISLPYGQGFILVSASWIWLQLWISLSLLFQWNLWMLHQTPTQPWYQSCRVSCRKINASLVLAVPKRRQLLKLEIY